MASSSSSSSSSSSEPPSKPVQPPEPVKFSELWRVQVALSQLNIEFDSTKLSPACSKNISKASLNELSVTIDKLLQEKRIDDDKKAETKKAEEQKTLVECGFKQIMKYDRGEHCDVPYLEFHGAPLIAFMRKATIIDEFQKTTPLVRMSSLFSQLYEFDDPLRAVRNLKATDAKAFLLSSSQTKPRRSDSYSHLDSLMQKQEDEKKNPDQKEPVNKDEEFKTSTIKQVTKLQEHLRAAYTSEYDAIDRMKSRGEIDHQHLWAIFPLGSEVQVDVIASKLGAGGIVVSKYFDYEGQFVLKCKAVKHFGADGLYMVHETWKIGGYSGVKAINSLPIQMITEESKNKMMARGVLSLKLHQRPVMAEYDGLALTGTLDAPAIYVKGRVMLDPSEYQETYWTENRHYKLSSWNSSDKEKMTIAMDSDMMKTVGEQAWLVWPFVRGFHLKTGFRDFAVEYVNTDIKFSNTAFDTLVIPTKAIGKTGGIPINYKTIIHSLVKFYGVQSEDVVNAKSQQLTILMHGPPGSGKTLTAQAMAEALHKPLYSVPVGQFGTTSATVLAELKKCLKRATRWNAILHLDEVDALCETRKVHDMEGNCILSNMLVEIENFVGILLMTTNRCGSIDPALQSRMKLIVPFEPLNMEQRMAVIDSRLKSIRSKADNKLSLDVDVKQIAKEDLSGRDIQSAFFIAETLAYASDKKLTTALLMETIAMQKHGQEIATKSS